MKNKKKMIVYLGFNNPLVHKRGVENVILFQSQSLKEKMTKYYVFFGDKDEKFVWKNIQCISIRHNLFRFFKLNNKIKKLSQEKEVIIHSHNYLMSFFLLRKTDIFTVHDGLYYLFKQMNHKLKKVFRIIEKEVYKKSKLIHFISEFSKRESLYKENKGNDSIIIYNTTPLEKVELKYKQRKWIINKAELKIFTVRSIEKRANIDLLIELAKKNKKYSIKIAGKGPLLQKYKEIVKEKEIENIEFLGYIPDEEAIKYYSECDLIVILAKYGEGFGLPIIEGYLYDKPVFASNVCAIPEIIIDRSFLVENNIEDLNEKIKGYLNKREKKFNFKEYYDKKFSYEKILSEYREMYNKILRG